MAKRISINSTDGASPLIASATDGDVLEIQNVDDANIEVDSSPIDKNNPDARGFILFPGTSKTFTGTLGRSAFYLTHSASGAKQVVWKRYTA